MAFFQRVPFAVGLVLLTFISFSESEPSEDLPLSPLGDGFLKPKKTLLKFLEDSDCLSLTCF